MSLGIKIPLIKGPLTDKAIKADSDSIAVMMGTTLDDLRIGSWGGGDGFMGKASGWNNWKKYENELRKKMNDHLRSAKYSGSLTIMTNLDRTVFSLGFSKDRGLEICVQYIWQIYPGSEVSFA